MNYWIEGNRKELSASSSASDILLVNDAEARSSPTSRISEGARVDPGAGPEIVVVKKGEHGAHLFADDWVFFVPGYPLEGSSTRRAPATPSRAASGASGRRTRLDRRT